MDRRKPAIAVISFGAEAIARRVSISLGKYCAVATDMLRPDPKAYQLVTWIGLLGPNQPRSVIMGARSSKILDGVTTKDAYLVVEDDEFLKIRNTYSSQSFRVIALSNFLCAFDALVEGTHGLESFKDALRQAFEKGPQNNDFKEDLEVIFDPTLSDEQIRATLTVLADYYRACGGVGLSAEFESQEAVTEEVHA